MKRFFLSLTFLNLPVAIAFLNLPVAISWFEKWDTNALLAGIYTYIVVSNLWVIGIKSFIHHSNNNTLTSKVLFPNLNHVVCWAIIPVLQYKDNRIYINKIHCLAYEC